MIFFCISQPLFSNKANIFPPSSPRLVSTTSTGLFESPFEATPLLHDYSSSFHCSSNVMNLIADACARAELSDPSFMRVERATVKLINP